MRRGWWRIQAVTPRRAGLLELTPGGRREEPASLVTIPGHLYVSNLIGKRAFSPSLGVPSAPAHLPNLSLRGEQMLGRVSGIDVNS